MRFTVQRDAFAEAVTWAARALPTRPVIPVLAGLLLQASGDRLTLACFDYEVSARVTIPAEVTGAGTALVPGRLLLEITRSLPGLPVQMSDDPDGVVMTCGEASFTLVTLPPDEYPPLPDLPQLAGTVEGGDFAIAIGQVTPAASKDDTLPLLTAVNLELTGETMTLAATDRYRLAMRDLGWAAAEGHEHAAALVPARVLADAGRMMGAGVPVRIMLREASDPGDGNARAADGAMIGFEAGERRLTTRLLAGEFPRYRERFPALFGCVADLPAEAFAEAVRRVSLVAERGTPVQLTFSDSRVTVAAATQGQARAESQCRPSSAETSLPLRSVRTTCWTGSSRPRLGRSTRHLPAPPTMTAATGVRGRPCGSSSPAQASPPLSLRPTRGTPPEPGSATWWCPSV